MLFITLLPACGRGYYPTLTPSAPTPPSAPSSLTADAVSSGQVNLHWFDNSNNEQGFKLYRDNSVIATLPANTTAYQDTGLRPATSYNYVVRAYNQAGESGTSLCSVRTPNPPIVVTLDRIGVVFDHDPSITGAGDIYVYVGVADGKGEPQTYRIPTTSVIKLNDNETKEIGQQIFSSDSVGDEVKIVAIAFESDAIHGLVWGVIGAALSSYLGGGAVGMITTLLKSQPSSEEGCPEGVTPESPDDDFVGAIEQTWTSAKNWGIGSYEDVQSGDFRLWFTIESPGVVSPSSTSGQAQPLPARESFNLAPSGSGDYYTSSSFSLQAYQTLYLTLRCDRPVYVMGSEIGRDGLLVSISRLIGGRGAEFNAQWVKSCEVQSSGSNWEAKVTISPGTAGIYELGLINMSSDKPAVGEYTISLKGE